MEKAILLAVAASLCTATASVCQRAGARNTGPAAAGFDARLIVRLARQPAWLLGIAAMVTGGVVLAALAGSRRPKLRGRRGTSRSRRAAVLGSATGISWGFMAAVIKELSSHLGDGIGALVTTWSLYLLLAAGAATMLLAAHALASGPLAASQPGFTILDPLTASLLGVFLFGEHIRTGAANLAGEALALAVVVAGAATLSRSCLLHEDNPEPPHLAPPTSAAPPPRRLPVT